MKQMGDLHQGLLMKVLPRWCRGLMAGISVTADGTCIAGTHLGQVRDGRQLQEAVDWLEHINDFEWRDLVRPFAGSCSETVGANSKRSRCAWNLLASVDGDVSLRTTRACSPCSVSLTNCGVMPPRLASQEDTDNAREALNWLRDEAKRLREGVDVSAAEKPTPIAGPGGLGKIDAGGDPKADVSVGQGSKPVDERTPEQRLAEARESLDRLIGLDAIKDQIQTLTNFLKMERTKGGWFAHQAESSHGFCWQSRHWENDRCSNCC